MTDYDEFNMNEEDNVNEIVEILKDNFDLEDFLEFKPTRETLYREAQWEFQDKFEPKLEKFYKDEIVYCQNSESTLFDHEVDNEHLYDFFNLVKRNLETKFDLNVFYNNPWLAKSMLDTYERRMRENAYKNN